MLIIDDIEQSITSINNKITNIENNLGNVGELLDEEYITQLINKLISENKISVNENNIVYFNDEYTRQKEYDTPEQEII